MITMIKWTRKVVVCRQSMCVVRRGISVNVSLCAFSVMSKQRLLQNERDRTAHQVKGSGKGQQYVHPFHVYVLSPSFLEPKLRPLPFTTGTANEPFECALLPLDPALALAPPVHGGVAICPPPLPFVYPNPGTGLGDLECALDPE